VQSLSSANHLFHLQYFGHHPAELGGSEHNGRTTLNRESIGRAPHLVENLLWLCEGHTSVYQIPFHFSPLEYKESGDFLALEIRWHPIIVLANECDQKSSSLIRKLNHETPHQKNILY